MLGDSDDGEGLGSPCNNDSDDGEGLGSPCNNRKGKAPEVVDSASRVSRYFMPAALTAEPELAMHPKTEAAFAAWVLAEPGGARGAESRSLKAKVVGVIDLISDEDEST